MRSCEDRIKKDRLWSRGEVESNEQMFRTQFEAKRLHIWPLLKVYYYNYKKVQCECSAFNSFIYWMNCVFFSGIHYKYIIIPPTHCLFSHKNKGNQCFPTYFEPRHTFYIGKIPWHTTKQNVTQSICNEIKLPSFLIHNLATQCETWVCLVEHRSQELYWQTQR